MIRRILEALDKHNLLVESWNTKDILPSQGWKPAVQTDHRLLKPGDIFVCIKGEHFDGHSVIPEALKMGASLIVCAQFPGEADPAPRSSIQDSVIVVTDTRKAAAIIARELWYNADNLECLTPKPFIMVGITGTNGKTTTSLMLYEALRILGVKAGWIGTLGYYIDGEKYSTMHTTPDIIQLNQIFAEMADKGITHVVMEVSSHALSLDRVFGVEFDYCLFTNLSRDHLDFHGDMHSYAETKYLLFQKRMAATGTAIINTGDAFGAEIFNRLQAKGIACHSLGPESAEFGYANPHTDIEHSSFELVQNPGKPILRISSQLIGAFNIQNLGLTALSLYVMGFAAPAIENAIQAISPVPGRIERVINPHQIGVFIDYAHTPAAIENLLEAVKELPHRRILCLLGAGGDRDKGKRHLMLKAALRYSDAVIVTDDNPRTEAPEAIIRDIVIDSDPRLPWWIIRDRSLAIQSLIRLAQPGDIVLICGKGHESYQEIEGIRQHFCDHEEAKKALDKKAASIPPKAEDELILPLDVTLLKLLFAPQNLVLQDGYLSPQSYRYLSIDSRTLKSGSVFVAIKGESFDGHRYIQDVLADPQNLCLGEEVLQESNSPEPGRSKNPPSGANRALQVSSSIQSWGIICQKYLQMFAAKRIALTGSTGKTSTKELIASILEIKAPCLRTAKNENNIIGLGKTILRIEPQHQYAVFELGTNHFGEIASLAGIAAPEIGIILNVGPSHLEFFGDENGVFREKIDLFKRSLSLKLYPGDDPRFSGFKTEGISIGYSDSCKIKITDQQIEGDTQSFRIRDNDVASGNDRLWQLPYGAPHYALNAAFAIVLAENLGFEPSRIQAALNKPVSLELRCQIESRGCGVLIADCYNANPFSMQKALEYWQLLEPEKPHYAILGDMLELGEEAELYHQMISAMLTDMKWDCLITVGKMAAYYHPATDKNPCHYASTRELIDSGLLIDIPPEACIIVKASHGIHLENLLPLLRGDI